jgi:YHS domain-containing protein
MEEGLPAAAAGVLKCVRLEEFSRVLGTNGSGSIKTNEVSNLEEAGKGRVLARALSSRETIPCEEEGMTIDPVCGMRVDERTAEVQTQFAGKKYFFCSEECRKEFEDSPEEYIEVAA